MPVDPTRQRRRRRRSLWRQLPVWAQWAIPFTVAAVLVVTLVVVVHYETNDTTSEAPVVSAKAIVEENREAKILIGQEQAPKLVAFKAGLTPAAAIKQAVTTYLTKQTKKRLIAGHVTSSSCVKTPGGTAGRQTYKCNVIASHVSYPFYGVVEPATRTVTYCRSIPPPIPSMKIPVSKACT